MLRQFRFRFTGQELFNGAVLPGAAFADPFSQQIPAFPRQLHVDTVIPPTIPTLHAILLIVRVN